VSAVQLWRYSIPSINGEGWAVFVLGSDGYFSACSDWGNYAFIWRAHGCNDFREFLLRADRDWDYFVKKLSPKPIYDGEKTEESVKNEILRRRRARNITAEVASTEWKLFEYSDFSCENGLFQWGAETKLDPSSFRIIYGSSYDAVQFVRKCMVRLIPLLKADLEAGK